MDFVTYCYYILTEKTVPKVEKQDCWKCLRQPLTGIQGKCLTYREHFAMTLVYDVLMEVRIAMYIDICLYTL